MKALAKLGAQAGYVAAVLQAIAFTWYCVVVFSNEAHTNPISWWLWFGETVVGLLIYADRTRDMYKWIAEATALVGVVAVAGYLAVRMFLGDARVVLATVEPVDIAIAIAAVAMFIFWLLTRKKWGPGISVWVFQIVLVLAIFPIVRATYANPAAEPLWPWILWTVSFSFQFLCAALRWDGYEPLVNPLNYAITHGLVSWIIFQGVAP